MIVVVGLVGVVMTAVPGLPADAGVHVPAPVPAIVAEPPGRRAQVTVWSGPAFGLAVTTICAVSVQPLAFVHMNEYVPAAVNVVIVVVGLVGVVMTAVPGLPADAGVHVPAPVAAMVAVPAGSTRHVTV